MIDIAPFEISSVSTNLTVALMIGIGFGFALEQAGFSSSRKLVGMFYGYDTTVLKVFFTAAIVALLGSQVLSYFGLLDLSLVYVNHYFVWPTIVGGIIMGAGFIIGGFCLTPVFIQRIFPGCNSPTFKFGIHNYSIPLV